MHKEQNARGFGRRSLVFLLLCSVSSIGGSVSLITAPSLLADKGHHQQASVGSAGANEHSLGNCGCDRAERKISGIGGYRGKKGRRDCRMMGSLILVYMYCDAAHWVFCLFAEQPWRVGVSIHPSVHPF